MEFIREIRKVEENTITIELPDFYKHKDVEVLVLPFVELPKAEPLKRRSFESLDYISIDTTKFKFNREELHER